jgi:hypothetical protein
MSGETVNFPPDPYIKQIYQAVSTSAGAVYLRNEDTVRLSSFSNTAGLTVSLRGVIVGLGGDPKTFTLDVVTDATRARKSVTARLGPGFVLYGAISVSGGSPNPGDVYATVEAMSGDGAGAVPLALLASGTPTTGSAVPFSGQAQGAVNVPAPAPRVITVTTPAAGAEWSQTIPAGVRWQLLDTSFLMTASAAAANRQVALRTTDGATTTAQAGPSISQTASQVDQYTFFPGAVQIQGGITPTLYTIFPFPSLVLLPTHTIGSISQSLQAGDQYSAIRLSVLESIVNL